MSELLAKLSLRTMPLDFGTGGGKVELTPQDVAAALGMCRDKFAVMVFLRSQDVRLPELADLDRQLATRQWNEWRERADALVMAQLQLAEAQQMWGLRAEFRTRKAENAIAAAKAMMWPALREDIYGSIRRAAIEEVCDPKHCRRCNGRKQFFSGELQVVCPVCGGSGQRSRSVNAIARMCSVGKWAFTNTWKPVFDWTESTLRDALKIGREEFRVRID